MVAAHLPDQPARIIQLSGEMIGRGEDPHSLYYWRASALRRLGRLDDATACIDRAIDLLPVGMTTWHQDYVRERELITTDARRLVSGSLLSLVEVLGIFVAITGFLIASGAVIVRAESFWNQFAAVGLVLVGALGFFVLLRLVVRFRLVTGSEGPAGPGPSRE